MDIKKLGDSSGLYTHRLIDIPSSERDKMIRELVPLLRSVYGKDSH